ncbi:uncharacterized protein LOC113202665 isoform X2 [Frankliniella occidentalis]|nr:uncharacterized protein LOC113202665 isoform X2 [Frankliniella occidentalis]
MRIVLPVAARVGAAAQLSCLYDLEGSQLYSIKWYLDDSEFYSFVPKEQPATRLYPDHGISVDLAQSNAYNVTLLNVTRSLAGFYKCEVSADMPYFHTGIQTGYLRVFEPPSRKPELTVEKLSAGVVRANCSTTASFPAANITWFVDNRPHTAPTVHFHAVGPAGPGQVPGAAGPSLPPPGPPPDLDEWSSSSLRVELSAKGPRALRCRASILDVWAESSDELPLRGPGDHPQLAPVRGAANGASSGPGPASSRSAVTLLALVALVAPLLGPRPACSAAHRTR